MYSASAKGLKHVMGFGKVNLKNEQNKPGCSLDLYLILLVNMKHLKHVNFYCFGEHFFLTWDWFLMDESNLKKLHLHCINQGMQL